MTRTRLIHWLLILVLAVGASGVHAQDAKKTLTVAAYNIENLFDVFDDPYTPDEGTRVKPRKELEQVATLIKRLDADLIGFSEIENEGVIRAFVKEFLPDAGYKYVAAAASNDGRGIRTAVASRLPIKSITSYRFLDLKLPGEETTWRFARDLMHVQIEVGQDRVLHAFVVHLKSKRGEKENPEGAKWRLAEAVKARQIIDDISARDGAWSLIMGDFNDTPDSPPLKALLDRTDAKPATGLTDVHASISAETRITYLKKPYRSAIDYILVNPALGERLIKDSAKVLSDVSLGADATLLAGSDHAPIVATFDIADKRNEQEKK